jgi:hypothetical protein
LRRSAGSATAITAPAELDVLSGRFVLSAPQIRQAAFQARNQARWRATRSNEIAENARPTLGDLGAAARAQGGRELEKLTRKIEPKQSWSDNVLPPDQEAQLREICDQARFRHLVMDAWGVPPQALVRQGSERAVQRAPRGGKIHGR